MIERLARIDATLNFITEKQAQHAVELDALVEHAAESATRIDRLTANIDRLTENVDRLTVNVNRVSAKADGNEQLFETIRAEARADRAETRRLFNDAVEQQNRDRAEARRLYDEAIAQQNRDREAREARADADREAWEARADAERRVADERYAAQMEVIQSLLVELTETNGNVNRLRNRVDDVEAS